jgi:hypothetical protein
MIVEVNGEDAVDLMSRAYGLDRLDDLDAGLPVEVSLYEVLDHTERQGLDGPTSCTLDADGLLRTGP